MKKFILLLVALFSLIIVCARNFDRYEREESGGIKWIEITDLDADSHNNCGAEIHGNLAVPTKFYTVSYLGRYNGIHYFDADLKKVKGKCLYNCQGKEIISYTEDITSFNRFEYCEYENHALFVFTRNHLIGILDAQTGEVILEPIYEDIYRYYKGAFEVALPGDPRTHKVYIDSSDFLSAPPRHRIKCGMCDSGMITYRPGGGWPAASIYCTYCGGDGYLDDWDFPDLDSTPSVPNSNYNSNGSIQNNNSNSSYGGSNDNNRHSTTKADCWYCNGSGRREINQSVSTLGQPDYKVHCNECGRDFFKSTGHGHIDCGHCGGTGKMR